MIDRETIDRIRAQTSITAVIGESVKLRKRGRRHVGLCPFHQEKTPSFSVDDERGLYHCFGCGASGDVFSFVEQQEGVGFYDAVRRLAERAGITVVETESEPERRQQDEARRRRQTLYDVGASIAAFYQQMLAEHSLAGCARAELARLGLAPAEDSEVASEVRQAFRIGYAPWGVDLLARQLTQAGLSLSSAQSMGVVAPGPDGEGYVDRFRHRLVLPILDLHGRVVAFVARALPAPSEADLGEAGLEPPAPGEQDPAPAMYLGSPASPVYQPRQVVFGLHQARQSIRAKDQCIVVNGCLEVLAMHARGLANAVGVLGGAVTVEQAQLLKRFGSRATFLFCDVEVGRRMVASGREICRQAGLLANVAALPAGVHLEEVLGRQGPEVISRSVAAARGLLEHLIDSVLDSRFITDESRDRAKKVAQVRELLATEPDPLVRAMAAQYADRVVERLGVAKARTLRELGAAVQRALRESPPERKLVGRVEDDS